MAITKSDVAKAIESLAAQGSNPTNDNILAILGSGSKTTINKYRKEILDEQQVTTIATAKTLKDAELVTVSQVIATLLQERVDTVQGEYTETVQQLEKQLADTTEQLEQVQAKLGEQVKQNDDITDKLKVTLASTDKAKEDYNALQAKYEQLLENQAQSNMWNHSSPMQCTDSRTGTTARQPKGQVTMYAITFDLDTKD